MNPLFFVVFSVGLRAYLRKYQHKPVHYRNLFITLIRLCLLTYSLKLTHLHRSIN